MATRLHNNDNIAMLDAAIVQTSLEVEYASHDLACKYRAKLVAQGFKMQDRVGFELSSCSLSRDNLLYAIE